MSKKKIVLPKGIYPLPNGRYQVKIRRDDYKGPKSQSFDSLDSAIIWQRGELRALDMGKSGQTVKPTGNFGKIVRDYCKELYPIRKWSGSKDYHMGQLEKDLGHLDISEFGRVTVIDYGKMLRGRQPRPLGAPGVASRLSYLIEVVETYADIVIQKDWDHLVTDMRAGMRFLRKHKYIGKGKPRDRVVFPGELEKIKEAHLARTSHTGVDLCAIIDILSVWPIRVGELCKIKWSDFEGERAVWLRQRKHPDSEEKQKNDDLVAMPVVFSNDVEAMLRSRPRHHERPFEYTSNECSQMFHYACKAAGVKNLHLHDLRAHAITALRKSGADYPLIAKISGHTDFTVMSKHYDRLSPQEVAEMVAALQRQAGPPQLKVAA